MNADTKNIIIDPKIKLDATSRVTDIIGDIISLPSAPLSIIVQIKSTVNII